MNNHIAVSMLCIGAMFSPVAGVASDKSNNDADSLRFSHMLEEVNVVAIKQEDRLREEAVSATALGQLELELVGATDMKSISNIVPNFYIPDYGSRITSSIYVRGIGARIDQPAVGLNVDNVPYLNKNAFDFDLADIASVEMLRGPQSTLFGRNTIGGLINITTLSPMLFQGWRAAVTGGTGNNYRASVGWYDKFSHDFATSVTANFSYAGGWFRNMNDGQKVDKEKSGALRWKSQWRVNRKLYLQNSFSTTILRQGGYPYEYINTGEINYNDTCFYRRFTVADGFTLNYRGEGYTISSITSLQHIDDNMTLDQDFLPESFFTLTQKQKETAVTEDFVVKGSTSGDKYRWLGGFFAFYRHNNMQAPVTFKDRGISDLIENHVNDVNPYYPIEWDSREFILGSKFKMPSFGFALYHDSKLDLGRWHLSAGIRLDYERSTLNYNSLCNTGFTIYEMKGTGIRVPYDHVPVDIDDVGKMHRSYFNWMPKVSALYDLPLADGGNVYASISKGYKAGGFNTQMFSEVLQQRLMGIMGIGSQLDVNKVVGYKPEYSWNYEIGSHLGFWGGKLQLDLSLFYIDCRDQQLTVFPSGTVTGRMMTNAGKTRSMGGELAIEARPVDRLSLSVGYGYTNAKFVKYDDGKENYKGRFVPYAPQNTLFAQAVVNVPLRRNALRLKTLLFDANVRGTGKIYWNESNDRWQKFYATVGLSATLEAEKWSLQVWGDNITDTRFHTFYFKSMGNEFIQRGKPARMGMTLRLNIPEI